MRVACLRKNNKHLLCTAPQQAHSLHHNKAPSLQYNKHLPCTTTPSWHRNKHLPCTTTSTFFAPQRAHSLHCNKHLPCTTTSTFLAPQQAPFLHTHTHSGALPTRHGLSESHHLGHGQPPASWAVRGECGVWGVVCGTINRFAWTVVYGSDGE